MINVNFLSTDLSLRNNILILANSYLPNTPFRSFRYSIFITALFKKHCNFVKPKSSKYNSWGIITVVFGMMYTIMPVFFVKSPQRLIFPFLCKLKSVRKKLPIYHTNKLFEFYFLQELRSLKSTHF